jgi:glycosyltransferase involved in cell wall biosynthesis
MFTATVDPVEYRDPWQLDFDTRLAMLCKGSPRAAYLYELPDTSTFRYRVFNIAQTLAAAGPAGPSASWFTWHEMDRMDHVLDLCDVLVLCRVRYTNRVARVVEMAKARGRSVLFDCDDLVFDPRYIPLIIDTLGEDKSDMARWDHWFSVIGRIGATFQLCDGAITTNAYLGQRASEAFGDARPTAVIPNYLERSQQALSADIFAAKERSQWARDGRITIGYFSGTPTHNNDFALCAGALARLMDEDPRIVLRFVGFLDPGGDLERHRTRIETFPLQDYMNLQRLVAGAEINLVPLQDNVFTNCKSVLKWFESATVGTVTISTPTWTYREAIDHDRTGWLVQGQSWMTILRDVLARIDNLRDVTYAARDSALLAHASENQTPAIVKALFGT